MSYSVLALGKDIRKQALGGLRDAANREEQRERANEQLKTAEQTKTMGGIGTGASIGAMVGGPVGALVGAGAGFLIGELF